MAAIRCLAAQYVAEARVAVWLATCNVRGVAPVTADLLAELCRQWPDAGVSPESLHLLTRLRFTPAARRKWARHFRLRWRVTWRRLAARSELPAAAQAAKAVFFCFADRFLGSFCGPETGYPIGPENGSLCSVQYQTGPQSWCHFRSPEREPPETVTGPCFFVLD